MTENRIAALIMSACFNIHRTLGRGLFESVYENILGMRCVKLGWKLKDNIRSLSFGTMKMEYSVL